MQDDGGASTVFLRGVDQWVGGLGRLRDVVRQHVLAAQLSEVLAKRGLVRARVLDVGCGQGTQSLWLARAGHEVTGLDISAELLLRFNETLAVEPAEVRDRIRLVQGPGEAAPEATPGPFDVILCHGVLMYLDDITPMLGALSGVAAEQATLSLLVRNGLATAMRDGLRGNYKDALAAFDSRDYVNRLGLPAHAHTPEDLDEVLHRHGWRRDDWYGVRVFTDHLDEEAPEELLPLLAAEREAGRRDPYRQVAALLHTVYTTADR
jgi:SAM-dependent methyltransferase